MIRNMVQPSCQQLHGRQQHQLVENPSQVTRSQPNRNTLARAKAFPLKHSQAKNQGRADRRNSKILGQESGCGEVYEVHRPLANSCRAAGKSFWKLTAL